MLELLDQDNVAVTSACADGNVTLPGLPARVLPRGLELLEDWATQRQQAHDRGLSPIDWLPAFLATRGRDTTDEAVCAAADFLGCRPFLELLLEVQLLRVALLEDEELERLAAAAGGDGDEELDVLSLKDVERELSQAELQLLPCLRQAPLQQIPQEVPPQEVPPQGVPPQEVPPQAPQGAPQEAPETAHEQATPHLPALLRRMMPLDSFERMVTRLCGSLWLEAVKPSGEAVRRTLCALGFTPAVTAASTTKRVQRDGKKPYLELPWTPLPGYEVAAIAVEAESHDQGWSSYPQDRGTTRNSWTWGELVLAGPEGSPTDPGDPVHMYTNLHAVDRWQVHQVALRRDSELVRKINDLAAGKAAAATTAAAAVAVGEGPAELAYRLQLLQCAAFPGWENHMKSAKMTLELCAL